MDIMVIKDDEDLILESAQSSPWIMDMLIAIVREQQQSKKRRLLVAARMFCCMRHNVVTTPNINLVYRAHLN